MVNVRQWPRRPGFNPRSSHTKDYKKWYLMPPCLTLSIIRYRPKVKWVNPGKGVAPSPTLWCSSYRKGSLLVTLDYGHQLYLLYLFMLDSKKLKPFNCVETITIFMCKQISCNSFKNKITYKVFTWKLYAYPFKCVQTNDQ